MSGFRGRVAAVGFTLFTVIVSLVMLDSSSTAIDVVVNNLQRLPQQLFHLPRNAVALGPALFVLGSCWCPGNRLIRALGLVSPARGMKLCSELVVGVAVWICVALALGALGLLYLPIIFAIGSAGVEFAAIVVVRNIRRDGIAW